MLTQQQESSQQGYELVIECLRDHFSEEEMQASGFLSRPFNSQFRRELSEISYKFFKRWYLAPYFSEKDGEMHEELNALVEELVSSPVGIRAAVAWPRGTGKTTSCDIALPLWLVLTVKYHYMIFIFDSLDAGKAKLRAVKDELEGNSRILEDFGNVKGPTWQEAEIITSTDILITVLGAQQPIRGRLYKHWRPQLIVCDDLEDDRSVRSEVQRIYLRTWFFQAVMMAGGRRRTSSIFYIGTLMHHDCLLAHLLKHPGFRGKKYAGVTAWAEREDLWEEWRKVYVNLADLDRVNTADAYFQAHKEEMLIGATTSWEGAPYYDLMVERVDIGSSAFATEIQNNPTDPDSRYFSKISYYRQLVLQSGVWLQPVELDESTGQWTDIGAMTALDACRLYMAVDPSMGQTTTGDPSAIQIVAKSPIDEMFSIEADIKVRRPEKIISDMLRHMGKYNLVKIGLESVGFQLLLKMNFDTIAKDKGIDTRHVVGLEKLGNKDMRIETLQPDLENGYLRIDISQLILNMQLEQWPFGAKDDGPDALEMARTMARMDKVAQASALMMGDMHVYGSLFDPPEIDMSDEPWAPLTVWR